MRGLECLSARVPLPNPQGMAACWCKYRIPSQCQADPRRGPEEGSLPFTRLWFLPGSKADTVEARHHGRAIPGFTASSGSPGADQSHKLFSKFSPNLPQNGAKRLYVNRDPSGFLLPPLTHPRCHGNRRGILLGLFCVCVWIPPSFLAFLTLFDKRMQTRPSFCFLSLPTLLLFPRSESP